ncbi:hypothetical protein ACO0LF_01720 [Undibacterium sp. Di27W]|uniref:hypothetical protein n=1 Tax=Undibacterium sp. Di27W TaxID=3413036 RepID=UPI003BF07426
MAVSVKICFMVNPFHQWKLNSPGGILAAQLLSDGELGAKSRKVEKTMPMENCRPCMRGQDVLKSGTYGDFAACDDVAESLKLTLVCVSELHERHSKLIFICFLDNHLRIL